MTKILNDEQFFSDILYFYFAGIPCAIVVDDSILRSSVDCYTHFVLCAVIIIFFWFPITKSLNKKVI